MADPINRLAQFSAPVADDQVNMLAPQLPAGHPSNMLMWIRDQIPQVQADDTSLASGITSRLGRTATAIPRAGLETAANWLRGVNDPNAVRIGEDTIAPLGLFGMAGLAARAPRAAATAARSDAAIARDLAARYPEEIAGGSMSRQAIAGGPRMGVVSDEGMTPLTLTRDAMHGPGDFVNRAPPLGRPANLMADNAAPTNVRGVHYTTADFDKFDPKQFGGTGDAFGVGVYSTPMEFAHAQRAKSGSNAYSYGDRFEEGARSIPTEHQLSSPFRIDMPENVGDVSRADWGTLRQNWLGPKWKHDMSPYEAADAGLFKDREAAAKAFNDALKAHGRDGVTVYDGGLMREVMAMEPGRVKSATTGETLFADNAKSSVPGTVAGGLDMSQEARMARAREQGFDTGTTYYHGTDRPIGEFQSFPGTYGSGVYMTPDASVASRYSERPHGYVADAPGAATGPSVLPLHVRGKLASPDELSDAFRPIYDRGDISYSQAMQEAMNTLRDRGYSGANHGAGDTLVFDPSNIRSPQAAFDPAKRDSANLLAANPSASSPGLAANSTQQDSPVLDILSKYGLY